MIEIHTFALLFQNFEPFFVPTFSIEGTWKPVKIHLSNQDLLVRKIDIFYFSAKTYVVGSH